MQNYKQIFGENIRIRRKALGISQENLALEINIDRTYISGIERGISNPSLDMIIKISERLGCFPDELLRVAPPQG